MLRERTLRKDHFSLDKGACLLSKAGRAIFYAQWERANRRCTDGCAPNARRWHANCAVKASTSCFRANPKVKPHGTEHSGGLDRLLRHGSSPRLAQIFKLLKAHGIALQRSVFLVHMSSVDMAQLQAQIISLINLREDDVRAYRLPKSSYKVVFGRSLIPQGMLLGAGTDAWF